MEHEQLVRIARRRDHRIVYCTGIVGQLEHAAQNLAAALFGIGMGQGVSQPSWQVHHHGIDHISDAAGGLCDDA